MPTLTDPDADEKYAPKVDTQHGTTDMSEFEREFDGSRTPIVGGDLRGRENQAAQQSVNSESAGRSVDSKSLDNKEQEMPPDRSGFSAADDMREKLGRGYTGKGSTKSKGLSKLYSSNSKFKKKVAIAGAAAGGSLIGGILIFLALLPLKIESIITNLDNKFSAASTQAIDQETENLYARYVKKNVLPNLNKKSCRSTISAQCVFGSEGKGAVGKLYAAWSQGRIEQKLATDYGIVISSSGSSGGYHLNVNGHSYKINDGGDIFNLSGTSKSTTNEVRQAVRNSLKEATLYDKVFYRFKLGKLLEAKYGIKRCVIACNARDTFSDSVKDKKVAAKAYIIQRVISPLSASYGLILQCIISGDCPSTTPEDAPKPDENGNEERTSKYQQQLQAQLDAFAEKFGSSALKDVLQSSKDISDKGFSRYIVGEIAEKVGVKEGTDKALDSALPVIGWVNFASNLLGNLSKAGPALKAMNYAASSAAAVQLYMTYRTVAGEMQSGHIDATELGSFTDQLGSNVADANGNVSDATSTPLYNSIFGGSANTNSASIFSNIFSSNVSAEGADSTYKCNDSKPVMLGKIVCDEENLSGGSATANAISNIANDIPGWHTVKDVVGLWNSTIGTVFRALSDAASSVTGWLFNHIPGFSSINQLVSSLTGSLVEAVTKYLIPSPFSDSMSGGRTFDMMAAGADVSANQSCQVELGCARVSDQTIAKIQNEQLAEAKEEFNSQSMFARMFNTNSPYSLVSRLAMDMPTSMLTATNSAFANLISSPFGKVSTVVGSLFSGNHAFASTSAQPDPFGVTQNAFTTIPSDPETYWNDNCTSGPMGIYDEPTDTLDISSWLNAKDANGNYINTAVNPDTGESYNINSNPCLLIHATLQTAGAIFEPSTLPTGSQNEGTE